MPSGFLFSGILKMFTFAPCSLIMEILPINTKNFRLFAFALAVSILAYGFPLTQFNVAIDGESPIYEDFAMSLGRWGLNLIRYHMFQGYAPYFTLIIGLVLTAMAAVRLTQIFKFHDYLAYLFCAIFVTVPQWAYQLVFMVQADAVPLALLLTVLCVDLFLQAASLNRRIAIAYYAGSVLSLFFALSIYQAVIIVPPLIYLCYLLRFAPDNLSDLKNQIFHGLGLVGIIAVSFGLYTLSVKVFCPSVESGYLSSYVGQEGQNQASDFMTRLTDLWRGKLYYGNKFFIIITLAAISLIVVSLKSRMAAWKIVLIMSIMVMPFLISYFITNGYHPPRLYLTTALVSAFLIVQLVQTCNLKYTGTAAAVFLSLSGMYFISRLYHSNYQIGLYDQEIMRRIDTTLRMNYPEFDQKIHPIYFHGGLPFSESEHLRLPESEIFGGSFFNWDNGANYRIICFAKFNGIANYRMVEEKDWAKIKDSIALLPVWPNSGSVRLINGVAVVKLGQEKGAPLPFSTD